MSSSTFEAELVKGKIDEIEDDESLTNSCEAEVNDIPV